MTLGTGQFADPRVALAFESDCRDQLVDRGAVVIKRTKQPQRFTDGEFVGELGLLELNAQSGTDGSAVAGPLSAQYFDILGIRRRQTLEDLDLLN